MKIQIGKNMFKAFIFLILSFSAYADIGESFQEINSWIKNIKSLDVEGYLLTENENDKTINASLIDIRVSCLNTDLLIQADMDQSKCFDNLKQSMLNYLRVKHDKRSEIILDSFNSYKTNLNKLYQEQVKLIQNSSPEDDRFFEL